MAEKGSYTRFFSIRYEGSQEVYTRDLVNPSRSGPLRDVISHTKNWCVLKSKKLYIFKDVQGPCSQIIDMEAYDIFPQKNDFTLTKPGSPSLVFAAEDEDDHTQWISALERCKYEDLDEIIPRDYKGDRQGGQNVLLEDPDYEVPIKVIEKIDRMELVSHCVSSFCFVYCICRASLLYISLKNRT